MLGTTELAALRSATRYREGQLGHGAVTTQAAQSMANTTSNHELSLVLS